MGTWLPLLSLCTICCSLDYWQWSQHLLFWKVYTPTVQVHSCVDFRCSFNNVRPGERDKKTLESLNSSCGSLAVQTIEQMKAKDKIFIAVKIVEQNWIFLFGFSLISKTKNKPTGEINSHQSLTAWIIAMANHLVAKRTMGSTVISERSCPNITFFLFWGLEFIHFYLD